MYDAKEAGRGRYSVHDAADHAGRLTDGVTWAEAIRAALVDDSFVLYQQPILDLRTNEIARHELLLRMVGAQGEHIEPATFLYIAERFGLVQEIDTWVVRHGIALDRRAGAARPAPVAGDQPLRPLADQLRGPRDDRARAGGDGDRPLLPDLRDHRDRRDREHPEGARLRGADRGAGLQLRARRLRRRLRVLLLPQAPAVRRTQDRRRVHPQPHRLRQGPGRGQVARADRDRARQADRRRVRRGRRDAGAARRYGVDFAQGFHIGVPEPVVTRLGHTVPV